MSVKVKKFGRLGYDLEYAVYDPGSESIIPAGHLPIYGVKGSPEVLVNGGLEVDCCAVEITPPPAYDEEEFVSNILKLKDEVAARFPTIRLTTRASHRFTEEALQGAPSAMTMGCDPDFNAWTGKINPRPKDVGGLRSYGGHIHIEGGTRTTIKAMDLTAGMFSVLQDPDTDRRNLYGKAGAYRTKPYGVEYRVLSNFWCGQEKMMREVYTITRQAQGLSPAAVGEAVKRFGGPVEVQSIINTSNRNLAKKVYEHCMDL